jgi:hypothetical protein
MICVFTAFKQSPCSHPGTDIFDTSNEPVNSSQGTVDLSANMNLAIISILVQAEIILWHGQIQRMEMHRHPNQIS